MDIAKLRKKFKETSEQEAEKPVAGQGEATPKTGEHMPSEVPVREGEQPGKKDAQTEGEAAEGTVQLLAFRLASEEYAFRVDEIEEIVRPQKVTRIPNTEQYLLGIASLRGKIIPVVDLRMKLSLGGTLEQGNRKQKILILKGPKGPIGVLIDSITGVIRPTLSKIVETPLHLPEAEMKFIEGVAIIDGRFVSVIRLSEAVAIEI